MGVYVTFYLPSHKEFAVMVNWSALKLVSLPSISPRCISWQSKQLHHCPCPYSMSNISCSAFLTRYFLVLAFQMQVVVGPAALGHSSTWTQTPTPWFHSCFVASQPSCLRWLLFLSDISFTKIYCFNAFHFVWIACWISYVENAH